MDNAVAKNVCLIHKMDNSIAGSLIISVVAVSAAYIFFQHYNANNEPLLASYLPVYPRDPVKLKHLERDTLSNKSNLTKLGYNNVGLTFTDSKDVLGWGTSTKLIAKYIPGTKNVDYSGSEPVFEYVFDKQHPNITKPIPDTLIINGKEVFDPKFKEHSDKNNPTMHLQAGATM